MGDSGSVSQELAWLTAAEQQAASTLGYTEDSWDAED